MFVKKIIGLIISTLCIILALNILNNYRIDNKISDDIGNIIRGKKYEKPIELNNFPNIYASFNYSCGPTTMSMVYSYLVKPKTEKELLQALDIEERKKGMLVPINF